MSRFYKIVITFLVLLLAGCKNNKTTVLNLGLFAGSPWDTPNLNTFIMFDKVIELFEKSHPSIKIIYKSGILKEDYSEWLSQSILKSNEPDLFLILPDDFTTFASIGILEELDSSISIQNPEGIYKNILASGKQKNKLYAVPFEINPTFMFVNKTLLQQENIEFPPKNWTWDEFLNYCKIITQDTNKDGFVDQFGVRNFNWTYAVFSNGETLFNEDGSRSFLHTNGVKQACELLASLSLLDKNTVIKNFESGNIAFEPFTYSTFRTYGYYPYSIIRFGKFDWATTLMPKGPKGSNAVDIKSLLLGISSRSKHKKESTEFMNFILNNRDAQISILRNSKGLPIRKDILYSEEARVILTKTLSSPDRAITQETIIETVENSIIVPRFKKYETTLSLIDPEISQIPRNSRIIENDLARLERVVNENLQK